VTMQLSRVLNLAAVESLSASYHWREMTSGRIAQSPGSTGPKAMLVAY
jgi:hypothetical protein